MHDVASMQKNIAPFFPGLLGIEFKILELDRVVAHLNVRPDLCIAGGIMHGGAYMAFADTLGAVGTILNLSAGQRTTTTDSKRPKSGHMNLPKLGDMCDCGYFN